MQHYFLRSSKLKSKTKKNEAILFEQKLTMKQSSLGEEESFLGIVYSCAGRKINNEKGQIHKGKLLKKINNFADMEIDERELYFVSKFLKVRKVAYV